MPTRKPRVYLNLVPALLAIWILFLQVDQVWFWLALLAMVIIEGEGRLQ